MSPSLGLSRRVLSFAFFCVTATVPCFTQSGAANLHFEQIPGSLVQISVGADGSVWGVNSSQQIYTYNSSTGSWVNIPGALTQVAAGNANAVWGVNAQHQIFHWNPVDSSWINVPGTLQQIAVGIDGDVWGYNAAQIYHLNRQTGLFVNVPSPTGPGIYPPSVGYPMLASAGSVYSSECTATIIECGSVLWYNPGTDQLTGFGNVLSANVGVPAAGPDGDMWATTNAGAIHYSVLNGSFNFTGLSASQLAVGYGAAVYALDSSGNIFRWDAPSESWVQIPGNLTSIAVGANGDVWGLNSSQSIFRLVGTTLRGYQTLTPVNGTADQISVAVDGRVWAISGNAVEYFDPGMQSLEVFPGAPSLSQLSAGEGANVWGLDSAGNIFRFDPSSTSWTNIPGELNLIEVGADGSVWGVNAAGQTYTYVTNAGWMNIPGQLDNRPGHLSVGADGTVWGINPGQQIYRYDPNSRGWINVPGSLVQISVGNATNVWGVNTDQFVYRYDTSAQRWINIPGAFLVQIAVAFDGSVWGVNAAGTLYQWNENTQTFNFVTNGVTNVALGNVTSVWAVNAATGAVFNWF